jgi:hypothetical protein
MNFNTKQTKALVITGQIRLDNNQTPTEIINYHIDYFKPDYTYLFLWDYEYELHGKEIEQIPNTEIIIGNSNQYQISDFEMQHLILQLRKYLLPSMKRRNDNYEIPNTSKALIAYMKNPEIKQQIFSQINLKHSAYIVTRYDIVYMEKIEKLQIEEIFQFLDSDKKTIATPLGGDAEGIGLGDLVIFANKSAANVFKNYYDELMKDCIKQIAPSFPEGFIRYMFVNKNNCDVFRFNFPCATKSCVERDGFLIHANLPQYNIFKNNIPIPIAKYPKFETKEYNNPIFDLPLIKNPVM